ncbi:MAG TPA: hypothetical protein VFF49_11355 [Thermodesulfobacteriota bacterium]|nr:hypothetical protein [Thermodesulfobacteriota bacterium]
MQKAIIHTTTRIIRRLTTDNVPVLSLDETAIEMVTPIDLDNGYWKLDVDNLTLLVPTQQEIDDSGVDEVRNAILRKQKTDAIDAAIDDISLNGATLARVGTYFQALRNLR